MPRDPLPPLHAAGGPPTLGTLDVARILPPLPRARAGRVPAPAPHLGDVVQALSIRYNNLVYELKARGEDVIVLSLGEAFFDIPLFGFADLPMPDGYHYSHSRGVPGLRALLAGYYGVRYGVPVDPASEILVTAGSKIAIHMSLMAILSPGDEVIVLEPAWVSYTEQVKLCHAVAVMVPFDTSIFQLGELVTSRTRAIIVNNPNNPSGKVLSLEELEHLHAPGGVGRPVPPGGRGLQRLRAGRRLSSRAACWTRRRSTPSSATRCPRTTGCRGGGSAT